jgi:regulation of enolase protein 1 (concanavalin A-like superfamily)
MTLRLNELSIPFSLSPSPGSNWSVDGDAGLLLVTAAAHSDIFIDPGDGAQLNAESLLNAATLLGVPPEGDFQLSARVKVDFESTFDAGVLLLWVDERHWAKLCFEFSPDREPMVVSVVTRGVADDANAFVVDGGPVWLRVARIDRAFAYHASTDGKKWRMIRFFVIDEADASTQIGFEAQSPTGEGCAVRFDDVRFLHKRLEDLRDGS